MKDNPEPEERNWYHPIFEGINDIVPFYMDALSAVTYGITGRFQCSAIEECQLCRRHYENSEEKTLYGIGILVGLFFGAPGVIFSPFSFYWRIAKIYQITSNNQGVKRVIW